MWGPHNALMQELSEDGPWGCLPGPRGEAARAAMPSHPYCKAATHSPAGVTDAASKVMEQEWREKAKKDLEEWNQRQSEQVEKNKINNR